jgi:hypothetical protein
MRRTSILALLLLVGCVSINSQLDAMVGKPLSVALQKWGPPDRDIKADGRQYYRWFSRNTDCEWNVEVDGNNTIRSHYSTGVGCFRAGGSR